MNDAPANPYGVINKDHLAFLIREKVLAYDPSYGFSICSELVNVTRCSMDGKSHKEDHKCQRCVNDTAIGACAKNNGITQWEAISLMVKGAESLEKWRAKVADRHGWILPSKSLQAAQSIFN